MDAFCLTAAVGHIEGMRRFLEAGKSPNDACAAVSTRDLIILVTITKCIWKPAVSLVYATLVAGFRRFRTRDIVTMCLYTDLFDIILNLRTLLVILLRKKKEFHLIVINAHDGKTEIIVVNVYTGITVK